MLTPKFKNKADMLAEFNAALKHMDETNPKDPTIIPKTKPEVRQVVESEQAETRTVLAEAAPLSRYTSAGTALSSFRVLAGLEFREISPWNPGIVGETRTPNQMMEDFGMDEDGPEQASKYHYKQDLGGYSPKAAHKALAHSHRVLSSAHAHHSYMHELDPGSQANIKEKLSKASGHAAYMLRGAADGADPETHQKLHGLADRHDRHAQIYAKGGRPKLEAIEDMTSAVEELL